MSRKGDNIAVDIRRSALWKAVYCAEVFG